MRIWRFITEVVFEIIEFLSPILFVLGVYVAIKMFFEVVTSLFFNLILIGYRITGEQPPDGMRKFAYVFSFSMCCVSGYFIYLMMSN